MSKIRSARRASGGPARSAPLVFLLSVQVVLPARVGAIPGELDTTFGGDGKVATAFGKFAHATGVTIQPDGKIVAAGGAGSRNSRFAVARYNPDGTLDPTFGGDGRVTTDFTGGSDSATDVAVQPDGKIVAAGGAGSRNSRFAVARYNPDGALDQTFGGDGRVAVDFSKGADSASGVAIQSDGAIVTAGVAGAGSQNQRFALARFETDGVLDVSFGRGGKVKTNLSDGQDAANALAIQADGRIVAVGDSVGDFALSRYLADGSLDTSFGGDGTVTTDLGHVFHSATDVVVQPDGGIVAAGSVECRSAIADCSFDFALIRYEDDGTLDMSFSEDGSVLGGYEIAVANSVAFQADGMILVGGAAVLNDRNGFAVSRFDSDGMPDASFGIDGRLVTTWRNDASIGGLAIQPDDKVVGAGRVFGNKYRFALARYLLS